MTTTCPECFVRFTIKLGVTVGERIKLQSYICSKQVNEIRVGGSHWF